MKVKVISILFIFMMMLGCTPSARSSITDGVLYSKDIDEASLASVNKFNDRYILYFRTRIDGEFYYWSSYVDKEMYENAKMGTIYNRN